MNFFKNWVLGLLAFAGHLSVIHGADFPLRNFRGVIVSPARTPSKKEFSKLQALAAKHAHKVRFLGGPKSKNFLFISKSPSENILTPVLCPDILAVLKTTKARCEPNWELVTAQLQQDQQNPSLLRKSENRHLDSKEIEALGGGQVALDRCSLIPSQFGQEEHLTNTTAPGTKILSGYWAQELVGVDLANSFMARLGSQSESLESEFQGLTLESPRVQIFDSPVKEHGALVHKLLTQPGLGSCAGQFCRTESFKGGEFDSPYFDLEKNTYGMAEPERRALYNDNIINAFSKLSDKKVDVMNFSLSGFSPLTADAAADFARDKNAILVIASGNEQDDDFNLNLTDPIHAKGKEFLLVGSLSPTGLVSDFSIGGPEVVVTAPSDGFLIAGDHRFSGSSGAAPLVTGAVAQIRALLPELSLEEVKNILRHTSLPTINKFFDQPRQHGVGTLNIYGAVVNSARVAKACLGFGKNSNEQALCRKREIAKLKGASQTLDQDLISQAQSVFGCNQKPEQRRITGQKLTCDEKQKLFTKVREQTLLNPNASPYWQILACVHQNVAFPANAALYQTLADNTKLGMTPNEHRNQWVKKMKEIIEDPKLGAQVPLVSQNLIHLGAPGRGAFLEQRKKRDAEDTNFDRYYDGEWETVRNLAPYRDPRALDILNSSFTARLLAGRIERNVLPALERNGVLSNPTEAVELYNKYQGVLPPASKLLLVRKFDTAEKNKVGLEILKNIGKEESTYSIIELRDLFWELDSKAQQDYLSHLHGTSANWSPIEHRLSLVLPNVPVGIGLAQKESTQKNLDNFFKMQEQKNRDLEAMGASYKKFLDLAKDPFPGEIAEKNKLELELLDILEQIKDKQVRGKLIALLLKYPSSNLIEASVTGIYSHSPSRNSWQSRPIEFPLDLVERIFSGFPNQIVEIVSNRLEAGRDVGAPIRNTYQIPAYSDLFERTFASVGFNPTPEVQGHLAREIGNNSEYARAIAVSIPEKNRSEELKKVLAQAKKSHRDRLHEEIFSSITSPDRDYADIFHAKTQSKYAFLKSPIERSLFRKALLNKTKSLPLDKTASQLEKMNLLTNIQRLFPNDKDFDGPVDSILESLVGLPFGDLELGSFHLNRLAKLDPPWMKAFKEGTSEAEAKKILQIRGDFIWDLNPTQVASALDLFEPRGKLKNPPTWLKEFALKVAKTGAPPNFPMDQESAFLARYRIFSARHGQTQPDGKTEIERFDDLERGSVNPFTSIEARVIHLGQNPDVVIPQAFAKRIYFDGMEVRASPEQLGLITEWGKKNPDKFELLIKSLEKSEEYRTVQFGHYLRGAQIDTRAIDPREKKVIDDLKKAGVF